MICSTPSAAHLYVLPEQKPFWHQTKNFTWHMLLLACVLSAELLPCCWREKNTKLNTGEIRLRGGTQGIKSDVEAGAKGWKQVMRACCFLFSRRKSSPILLEEWKRQTDIWGSQLLIFRLFKAILKLLYRVTNQFSGKPQLLDQLFQTVGLALRAVHEWIMWLSAPGWLYDQW